MRIKFHEAGFRELLTSAGAEALVQAEAERLAASANAVGSTTSPAHTLPYYVVEDASDDDRARRRVVTDGPRAAAHEARTQALERGL